MQKWPKNFKQTEKDLLSDRKSKKDENAPRMCKYPDCPESMGFKTQEVEMFYKIKVKCKEHKKCSCEVRYRIDRLCNVCRKFVNSESRRKSAEKGTDTEGLKPIRGSKQFKIDARICETHGIPKRECGCEVGARYHKSPSHKKALSEAMKRARKFNPKWKGAIGNRSNSGRAFTQAHKDRIAKAQRRRWKVAKMGTT